MNIYDITDASGEFLDGILKQLTGGEHSYKGALGNPRRVLKHRHRKGNGIRLGNRFISMDQSLKGGALLIGKTGSGKSTKVFLVNLLCAPQMHPTSFVCLDLTKELRQKSGGFLSREAGYGEDVVNFSEADLSSVIWNPIEKLKESGIGRFAGEFVAIFSNDNPSDPIWNNMSTTLISILVHLLKLIEDALGTNRYTNLYNVRYLTTLIQGEPNKVNALIAKYATEILFSDYKAFISNDSKFLNSVLSSVLSVLVLWTDENVIRTTSSTSINMESYRSEQRVLWVQGSIMAQKHLTGLNSLFLKEWFTHIVEAGIPEKDSNVIAFLADEMSAVRTSDKNFIPFITSQIRKFNSYGIWGYQSFSQCEELYGKQGASTLKANTGTVLYLGKQDLETATQISRSLGRYSFEKDNKTATREVLTAEEAMYAGAKEGGILLCGNERPIVLKRIRAYYEDRKLRKKSEIPVGDISTHNPMPPLLPIDELIADVNWSTPKSDED